MIRITVIILLLMFCFIQSTHAQYTSRLGRFEVEEVKGCKDFTVKVKLINGEYCGPDPTDPTNASKIRPCDIYYRFTQFGTGSVTLSDVVAQHIYTEPGVYTLRILFGASSFDDITITVLPNVQPKFDLYSCGGNTVSIIITDTNYDQYVINYNDGSPLVVVPSGSLARDQHTFASSGNKTITVRGRYLGADDNCNPVSKTINVQPSLQPATITQLQVIDNARIRLDFNNQPNVLYRLEISSNNGTTFQNLKTIYNKTADTVANLRTDDLFYCFRLITLDPCSNNAPISPPNTSNIVCSINLDAVAQNNQNNLSWSTFGTSNFRLTRIANTGSTLITSESGFSKQDVDILCGTEYCYRLAATYSAPGFPNIISSSLQKCVIAISTDTPSPVENISAIVGEGNVQLQWAPVVNFTPAEFSVLKSNIPLTTTTNFQVTDATYTTGSGACYTITYKDVCNNLSPPSLEACPIHLNGNVQSDNSISLSWSAYTGWTNGVSEYIIEKYTLQGQLLQTFQLGTNTSFVDNIEDLNNQSYRYVVKAIATEGGVAQSVSNVITITKDPNLFYPTAFTPNGDNLNDLFTVFGQYVVDFEMSIFNRWGELMFTTDNLQTGWDGKFRGNEMPEGTYTFTANITDRIGRTFKRSGSVMLLRKGR